jgi:hypothetical protein
MAVNLSGENLSGLDITSFDLNPQLGAQMLSALIAGSEANRQRELLELHAKKAKSEEDAAAIALAQSLFGNAEAARIAESMGRLGPGGSGQAVGVPKAGGPAGPTRVATGAGGRPPVLKDPRVKRREEIAKLSPEAQAIERKRDAGIPLLTPEQQHKKALIDAGQAQTVDQQEADKILREQNDIARLQVKASTSSTNATRRTNEIRAVEAMQDAYEMKDGVDPKLYARAIRAMKDNVMFGTPITDDLLAVLQPKGIRGAELTAKAAGKTPPGVAEALKVFPSIVKFATSDDASPEAKEMAANVANIVMDYAATKLSPPVKGGPEPPDSIEQVGYMEEWMRNAIDMGFEELGQALGETGMALLSGNVSQMMQVYQRNKQTIQEFNNPKLRQKRLKTEAGVEAERQEKAFATNRPTAQPAAAEKVAPERLQLIRNAVDNFIERGVPLQDAGDLEAKLMSLETGLETDQTVEELIAFIDNALQKEEAKFVGIPAKPEPQPLF